MTDDSELRLLRRLAARGSLALLASGALFGLWCVRVATVGAPWPLHTHHPRVLAFVVVIVGWVVVVCGAVFVACTVVWLLLKEAGWVDE